MLQGLKSFKSNRARIILFKLIPDIFSLALAALISYNLRFLDNRTGRLKIGSYEWVNYKQLLVSLVIFWILFLSSRGVYTNRHTSLFINDLKLISRPSLQLFLTIGLISYLAKAEFSRSIFLLFFLSGTLILIISRLLINSLIIHTLALKKKMNTRLLIVGLTTTDLDSYTDWLMENHKLAYKISGRLLCAQIDLDWIEKFDSAVNDYNPDEVLLLPGIDSDKNFSKFIHYLQDLDIPINWIPNDSGNLGYWQIPHPQTGIPFLTFKDAKIPTGGKIFKRIFDMMFSLFVLVLLFPVFLIISILILVLEGRPIFFSQIRIGRNGKKFKMFKFRTMIQNADKVLETVPNELGNDHVLFKNRNDPRITKIGAYLRRYSLDELPQFINSFLGNISVVGPRPALPRETVAYSSLYERRLLVKPGITGPWQISGRSDLDLKTSIALDLNYVVDWTFSGDMWIIVSTPFAVLRKTGAY